MITRLITALLIFGIEQYLLQEIRKINLNLLGSIHCFLIKFEENPDQKKYSYAQYKSKFILPDFSMTICLRLEF